MKSSRITVQLSKWLSDRISRCKFPEEEKSATVRRLLRQAQAIVEAGNESYIKVATHDWSAEYAYQFRVDEDFAMWLDRYPGLNKTEKVNRLLSIAVSAPRVKPLKNERELLDLLRSRFPSWEKVSLLDVMDVARSRMAESVARDWILKLQTMGLLTLHQDSKVPWMVWFDKADGKLGYDHLTLIEGTLISLKKFCVLVKSRAELVELLKKPAILMHDRKPVAKISSIGNPNWQRIMADKVGEKKLWYLLRQGLWQIGVQTVSTNGETLIQKFQGLPPLKGFIVESNGIKAAIAPLEEK